MESADCGLRVDKQRLLLHQQYIGRRKATAAQPHVQSQPKHAKGEQMPATWESTDGRVIRRLGLRLWQQLAVKRAHSGLIHIAGLIAVER
eukprot:1416798-Prymnesium_polylepis.1